MTMAQNSVVNSTISPNATAKNSATGASENDTESIAILATISVAIILINSLVFALFKFSEELRTPANYLLLSLSVSDFLNGLVNIPLFVIITFTSVLPPDTPLRQALLAIRMGFHNMTAISGIYHILVITAERFCAITRPLSHLSGSNSRKIFQEIASVWVAAAFLGFIPTSWFHVLLDPVGKSLHLAYVSICFAVVFGVPYVIMIYAHIAMYRAISCRSGRGRGAPGTVNAAGPRRMIDDKKTVIIFALMAFVFLVCWFPWFLLNLSATLGKPTFSGIVYQTFTIIRYLSAVINPLLYTLLKRDFQQALSALLRGKRSSHRRRGSAFTSTYLSTLANGRAGTQRAGTQRAGNTA